jgi:hypothetical protein
MFLGFHSSSEWKDGPSFLCPIAQEKVCSAKCVQISDLERRGVQTDSSTYVRSYSTVHNSIGIHYVSTYDHLFDVHTVHIRRGSNRTYTIHFT